MRAIRYAPVVVCYSRLQRTLAGVKRTARVCGATMVFSATLLLAPSGVALGQERSPQSQDIIDALKPVNPPGRSRNLIVNKAPATEQATTPARQDPKPDTQTNLPGQPSAIVQTPPAPPAAPPATTTANVATTVPNAPMREPARQGDPPPSISLAISFGLNSFTLTNDGRKLADSLGQALTAEALSEYRFIVEGHTDSSGSPVGNQALSLSRAEAVRNHLISVHHINPERLRAVGKGSSEPADASNPRSPQNRRVRIVLDEG